MLPRSDRTGGSIDIFAESPFGGRLVKLVLQIVTCWVALSSCFMIPILTWAYFRAERRTRRYEAERAAEWLGSTGLKPPS